MRVAAAGRRHVALAGLFLLHRVVTVQSRGRRIRARGLDAVERDARAPRARPSEVGYLDPDFFVYSDETDFCKRLRDAGWDVLYVPGRARDPPRPADHRPPQRPAADRGVPPQPRPATCASTTPTPSACSCGCARRPVLPRAWRPRPRCSPVTTRAVYLLHARQELTPGTRRGHPRGGRGVQPAGANRTLTAVDHPDLAQLAAVVAAAGRGAAAGRAGTGGGAWRPGALGAGRSGPGGGALGPRASWMTLSSPAGAAAGALGLALLCAAAAVFVARPAWVPAGRAGRGAAATADRLRVRRRLSALDRRGRSARAAAAALPRAGGRRAGARLARGPRRTGRRARAAAGGGAPRGGVHRLRLPVAHVGRRAGVRRRAARCSSPCRSRCWWAWWPAPRSPTGHPRALARIGVGLAAVFAAVGLYQAATRELFFFAPNLAVSNANSDYFRVTSLFGDPSLYGRHVVLGLGLTLVALALRRVDLRLGIALLVLLWAGLFVSYSQSSMVALIAVTLFVAAVTGGRAGAAGGGGRPGGRVPDRRRLPGLDRDPGRLAAARDQRPHPARGGHRARRGGGARGGRGDRRPAAGQPPAVGRATGPRPTSSRTPPR